MSTDLPQWLQDAFQLAHPSALDPDGWKQAKTNEALRLAAFRDQSLAAGPSPAVGWAVANRLSRIPDLFVYDKYSPPDDMLRPAVIVDTRRFSIRQAGFYSIRGYAEVEIGLAYLVRSSYEHLAYEATGPNGTIIRTLMDDHIDDDLAKLGTWVTIDPITHVTEYHRVGDTNYLTVEMCLTVELEQGR